MIDSKQLAKWSGLLGLGLAVVGGFMYYRERKAAGKGLFGQFGAQHHGGRFAEAPIVDSFDDGNMKTTLRESANMTIEERIASIQKQVEKSVQDPEMRKLAMQITKDCPERDGMCESKAIYKWVKKHVRYTGDIAPVKMSNGQTEGIDLYQSARRTVEMGGGDCDDATILIETLLSSIGITARSRVTAEDPNGEEGHIYPIALLPKFAPSYAVALDTTLPGNNNFGKEAPAGRIVDYDA